MLVLGIDTSQKVGSVALVRVEEASGKELTVIATATVDGGTFSAQLVPTIFRLLKENSLTARDIGGIAAALGPGSFTGLRIGLAAVKGLAESLNIPVVGVSVLEALTVANVADGNVLVLLDAGRNELYIGGFELRAGEVCSRHEYLVKPDDLAVECSPGCAISPDAAIAAGLSSFRLVPAIDAVAIARVGTLRLSRGESDDIVALDASYLRPDESLFTK